VVPRAQVSGNHDSDPAVEAVVFDFGGVLITSITNQVGSIAETHGVDTGVMLEILLGPRESDPAHPWHRAERGEIPVADIQAALAPWALPRGVELRGDEIERVMVPGGYTVVDEMIDAVDRLRADGYRTGLLTNTFAEFRPTMERDIPFELFDVVVESFAVGSRKPERSIYEATRERLAVDHTSILYLDDFEQNLTEPVALGWSTIRVDDPHRALDELHTRLRIRPGS
jgi:putative hydrolase of the HAD superfamily